MHSACCGDNLPRVTDAAQSQHDEWDGWIRDWLLAQTDRQRPLAVKTVEVYSRGVRQFVDWLAENEPDVTGPGDVTARHIGGWLGHLARTGRGESTRRVRLMTLRAFFGWVVTEPGSPLQVNPAASLAAPVVELPAIRVVSDDDLRAILATCSAGSFVDLRDTAVLRVLIACGLRRAELAALDVDDLDLRHGELHVLGKGGKPRVVSIGGNRTTLALSRYLRVRRTHPGTADAALFLTTRPYREQWRLTGGGVREMLRRRSVLAGIDPIHPHALRHAWADANKRAGLSDEDLERLAGWTSPMMSRRYGRALADDRARQAHRDLGAGDRV